MLRVKGDPSIRLMAHIRYRTKELYTSRDFQALAKLNTTVIHAESWGTDSLHSEAEKQNSFLPTPEGWRLQATPNLYPMAHNYGLARGWPTQWMVLEGVGVDASIPHTQQTATFTIDQIELYAPKLRFPNSPKFRKPFWVLENFENSSPGLIDAKVGPPHRIQTHWTKETIFGGIRQQQVTITFSSKTDSDTLDELYDLSQDPGENRNLLPQSSETAQNCRVLLQKWIDSEPGDYEYIEISPAQREAMESLGYAQ